MADNEDTSAGKVDARTPVQGTREDGSGPATPGSGTAKKRTPAEQDRRAKLALRPFDVLGNYQVLKVLGAGGMADVYLARAMLTDDVDKLAALKTVLPEFGPDTRFGAMFLREAQVSAGLRHPNLIQVFDFGEALGRPYLAMEYIHGRELTAVKRVMRERRKPVGADFVVSVGVELCKALDYVHTRRDLDGQPLNLVHRDVSPANILLSDRSEVKLMDFGVAAVDGVNHTEGMLIGKIPYMTLDQARGGKPVPQWDLFAVGVILYELLTLRRPYPNVPLAQLQASRERAGVMRPSRLNPRVPPALDELVLAACAGWPDFATAAQLRSALERVQSDLGVADVGAWVKSLFGDQLARDQQEIEALTSEGRKRSGFGSRAATSALERRLQSWRRRLAASRAYMSVSRRPWLLRSGAAALVAAVLAGAIAVGVGLSRGRALDALLARADAQAGAGRLVGPSGSETLGQLLEARKLAPDDARVQRRLALLAGRLVSLGDAAAARDDREEALAHYQAALEADPSRKALEQKLRALEAALLGASRGKVVRRP